MKSLNKIIEHVRRKTNNADNSNTVASDSISTEDFISAVDDAQTDLQTLISNVYADAFQVESLIDIVQGQEEYTIPNRVFANNRIRKVEYSRTGELRDYIELPQRGLTDRYTETGCPTYYIKRAGNLLINPIPNTTQGKMRVSYEKTLDNLDIRRAKVTSTTGTPITSITIDNVGFTTDTAITNLVAGDDICISDDDGVVVAYNIPVTAGTATTITVDSHTLSAGESISAGDYVTIGRYTTTHSKLPDICEGYMRDAAILQISEDDDLDERIAARRLLRKEEKILKTFEDDTRDITYIPIIDKDFI